MADPFELDAFDFELAQLNERMKECGLELGPFALSGPDEPPASSKPIRDHTGDAVKYYNQFMFPKLPH